LKTCPFIGVERKAIGDLGRPTVTIEGPGEMRQDEGIGVIGCEDGVKEGVRIQ